jgi:streptogramin lyase
VAVANRNGGVTKIYAREDYCEESNGMPGLQTSNSAAFLPWGQEECVAWHTPMNYQSQRPVAWGRGNFNEGTCVWDDEELWTAGTNNGGSIDIYVLDGDDGSTKEMIAVPTGGNGLQASYYGIYGGAVDGNGDFWGSQLGSSGRLIRVNRDDMSYDVWDTPNNGSWYGMTVDSDGYVWLCSSTVARFDPADETWQTASVGGYTGCMADAAEDGLLWMSAGGNGVVGVNRDTLLVEKSWNAGGSYGISIDFEGYVWAVAYGTTASKIDPETGQFWTYNGLVGAYTYSDMTGYALSNVGTPSG